MDLHRIRIRTTFFVSLVAVPLYVAVGCYALANETAWVAACSLVGLLLCLHTAWRARRVTSTWRPPVTIALYLMLFITATVLSGYMGGAGVMWLPCVPPLTLLVHGSRVGSMMTFAMFVVLLVGLADPAMVDPELLPFAVRLRLAATYAIIAVTCIAYAVATDWFGRKLDEAGDEIRSLRALLTMCSYCKRVEVEQEWRSIEAYLGGDRDLRISHGICPTCFDDHYPKAEPSPADAAHD